MSPKQLYFTILSLILTIVFIISGVYFIRSQQDNFASVNILSRLYNAIGQEMVASAKAIDIDYFDSWLTSENNSDLLSDIKKSKQEFVYCPEKNGQVFLTAWVKKPSRLKTGSSECFSLTRGKVSLSLDCKKALVCVQSK